MAAGYGRPQRNDAPVPLWSEQSLQLQRAFLEVLAPLTQILKGPSGAETLDHAQLELKLRQRLVDFDEQLDLAEETLQLLRQALMEEQENETVEEDQGPRDPDV